MSENRVVIYSNGIADFQRSYQIAADGKQKISIPVRQDHLADVLASFNVYGDVKLETPPTFRPSNETEGNISIDPDAVLEGLATDLSGARIRVEHSGTQIEGRLVGLHVEPEASSGSPIKPKSMVILSDAGLRRCPLREIQSFQFLDDAVQAEIDKALQRNYQRIKPNSTFVDLELSTAEPTEAIVQYTIPAAAWKISYRLRMATEGEAELQGFAIVDNNTEEDWKDFHVAVVTGEPITFSTDLADSKSPRRRHVDLVSGEALGAVEPEAVVMGAAGGAASYDSDDLSDAMERPMAKARQLSRVRSTRAAAIDSAAIAEVGDFSIFESKSTVSIPAKRSAVIPVFNVALADARTVLHYKYQNHEKRAYRSVEFTNQAEYSLGRGVCTVYEEGGYAGNCIVPAMKPGESRLLPHALETGVLFDLDWKRRKTKVVGLRLANGVCYTSTRARQEYVCRIVNSRDQEFKVVFDHRRHMQDSDVEATLAQSEASDVLQSERIVDGGLRYTFTLAAKATAELSVVEHSLEKSSVQILTVTKQQETFNITWIEKSLVATNGPLANDPGIRNVLVMHAELEAKQQQITDLVNESERLAGRQKRLRENIKSGGQDELTSRWRNDLDAAEQAIRRIEEEQVPSLRKEEKAIRVKLVDAIRGLSAEWSEGESAG